MDNIVQGSPEWFAIRLGKVTASKIADVCARTQSGWGASRKNYMADLIAERLTGSTTERFTNAAMQWGTDMEPAARSAYQFYTDVSVKEIGFVPHPSIAESGASPDGLIGDDGMVEIKCPNTATHIETLRGAAMPEKYSLQIQWQMACTGRQWCDFVSYDPRMPESMRLFIRRVVRDDTAIRSIEKTVTDFLTELRAIVAELRTKYGTDGAERVHESAKLLMSG